MGHRIAPPASLGEDSAGKSDDRRRLAVVYELVRDAILQGRFAIGEKLLATRELAKHLRLSRNTVSTAYEILVSEGYVQSRTGAGTFVISGAGRTRHDGKRPWSPRLSAWAAAAPEHPRLLEPLGCAIDFRPGVSRRTGHAKAAALFRRAVARLGVPGPGAAGADDPAGRDHLRTLLAAHLRRARGTECRAHDVVLTTGTHQSLDIVARLFSPRAGPIAIEDPGFPLVEMIFSAQGFETVAIPVDEEGVVVKDIPDGVQLIYVTPNNQFPLGVRLSARRRAELLRFAARNNALAIEDDYDGELHRNVGLDETLKSVDLDQRVIYLGSFSKYLTNQFRFGYAVLPTPLRDIFVRAKWLIDRQLSDSVQVISETLLESGFFGRIMRQLEAECSALHRELAEAIETRLGRWLRVTSRNAGLNLTALAAPELDVPRLVGEALERGVGLYDLKRFSRRCELNGLVFGLAALNAKQIRQGIAVVEELAAKQGPR